MPVGVLVDGGQADGKLKMPAAQQAMECSWLASGRNGSL